MYTTYLCNARSDFFKKYGPDLCPVLTQPKDQPECQLPFSIERSDCFCENCRDLINKSVAEAVAASGSETEEADTDVGASSRAAGSGTPKKNAPPPKKRAPSSSQSTSNVRQRANLGKTRPQTGSTSDSDSDELIPVMNSSTPVSENKRAQGTCLSVNPGSRRSLESFGTLGAGLKQQESKLVDRLFDILDGKDVLYRSVLQVISDKVSPMDQPQLLREINSKGWNPIKSRGLGLIVCLPALELYAKMQNLSHVEALAQTIRTTYTSTYNVEHKQHLLKPLALLCDHCTSAGRIRAPLLVGR